MGNMCKCLKIKSPKEPESVPFVPVKPCQESMLFMKELNTSLIKIKKKLLKTEENAFKFVIEYESKSEETLASLIKAETEALKKMSSLSQEYSLLEIAEENKEPTKITIYFHSLPYTLLDLINNPNLAQSIVSKTEIYLEKTLKTLEKLSKEGIHHYNINPQNILISADFSQIKIYNFIIPESYDHYRNLLKLDIQNVYENYEINDKSMSFMAPEIMNKKHAQYNSEKIDVYALAQCIVKLLMYDSLEKFNDRENHLKAVSESKTISPKVKELLHGMLYQNPEERFSIEECLDHLKENYLLKNLEICKQVPPVSYHFEKFEKLVYRKRYFNYYKECILVNITDKEYSEVIRTRVKNIVMIGREATPTNLLLEIELIRHNEGLVVYATKSYNETIRTRIDERKRSHKRFVWDEVMELALHLVDGFKKLADFKVFHKYLTPDKLVLTPEGIVKVTGFCLDPQEYDFSEANNYLAPEILANDNAIIQSDFSEINFEKTDVFSLGLLFLEMITGLSVSEVRSKENYGGLTEIIRNLEIDTKFKVLLEKMTESNPVIRPTFNECFKILTGN